MPVIKFCRVQAGGGRVGGGVAGLARRRQVEQGAIT